MHSISGREFNQNVSKARRTAEQGPVFITDRGTPVHVLLTIEAYHKLLGKYESVADSLFMPEGAEIELPLVPRADIQLREVDLS